MPRAILVDDDTGAWRATLTYRAEAPRRPGCRVVEGAYPPPEPASGHVWDGAAWIAPPPRPAPPSLAQRLAALEAKVVGLKAEGGKPGARRVTRLPLPMAAPSCLNARAKPMPTLGHRRKRPSRTRASRPRASSTCTASTARQAMPLAA